MEIKNFKDFTKLIAICRKQGVKSIQLGDMKVELGDVPIAAKSLRYAVDPGVDLPEMSLTNISASIPVPQPEIPTDMPSEEQLLFWSSEAPQSEPQ